MQPSGRFWQSSDGSPEEGPLGRAAPDALPDTNEQLRLHANVRTREAIARALSGPLPGSRAHREMVPAGRHMSAPAPPPTARHGAVLIAMAPRTGYTTDGEASAEDAGGASDDQFLGIPLVFPLIERSFDRGPHAGQIALPGGRMEMSDRSLTTTALREAAEEVSLDPAYVTVLGSLSPFYLDVSNYLVTPIVGWVDDPLIFQALAPQPQEVASILCGTWPAMAQTRALRIVRARGTTMQTSSYRVGAHTVWGATAMILNELFTLLGHYTSAGSTYEGSSSGREK